MKPWIPGDAVSAAVIETVNDLPCPLRRTVGHFRNDRSLTQKEIDTLATQIGKKAAGDAVVWFAYPKKTSKNYKSEISREELTGMMAGGEALEELSHELAEFARTDEKAAATLTEVAREFGAEAEGLHVEQLPAKFTESEQQYADQLPPTDGEGKR